MAKVDKSKQELEAQIKKKEKQLKKIFDIKDINFKEWYLKKLTNEVEENLDSLFELIEK
ncbi:MAG: hypothetical protein E7A11_16875 [Clostridium sp.]|uniref:hypothetical protein n=1 Tax=Clostridium TaxID=1485 RepID=UPI00137B88C1|nr:MULTISPECIES: hypothetical protein [Clostridium]MBS5926829.1 hypothetical protein [Clostridium sp.]MDB2104961.1 hypothetical protein [Clostridium paraputrificum]MDU1034201.1 hypothetical protein [Clostridium sp.]MDU1077194.1 hypothetical protein [Clostridium sp.]MDU1126931.1 hypothetical protein [Clostridium sp.]